MIVDLNLRLSYSYVAQRRGSGHGDTPPGPRTGPLGAAPLTSPGKRQTRFSFQTRAKLKLYSSLICARSMVGLWSAVNQEVPEMQDSVHDSRCGRRDVERIHVPAHRQGDQPVACGAHPRTQPAALRAEHHHDLSAVVG